MYRFVSRKSGNHFYAAGERERDELVKAASGGWIDEGVAWYAYGP